MSTTSLEQTECQNDIKNSSMYEIFGESEEYDNLYDQFKVDYGQCCNVDQRYRNNCKRAVKQSYYRRLPGISTLVYPWKNYDFNYSNVLDQKINMNAIGASSSGSMSSLGDNISAATKIYSAAMIDPIPDKNAEAGVTDDAPCVDPGITIPNDVYDDSIDDSCHARLGAYFGAMVVAVPMIVFGGFPVNIAGGIMAAAAQSAWAEPNFKKCFRSFENGDGAAGDLGEVTSLGIATIKSTGCRNNVKNWNTAPTGNNRTLPVENSRAGDCPYYKCNDTNMTCAEAQNYVRKRVPVPLTKYPKSYQWEWRDVEDIPSAEDVEFGAKTINKNYGDTSQVYSSDKGKTGYTAKHGTWATGYYDTYVCTRCNNKLEKFNIIKDQYNKNCMNWEQCNVAKEIRKDMYNDLDTQPYNHQFFNRNLKGENSSSYYIKSGICYQPNIYTKKACEALNPKTSPPTVNGKNAARGVHPKKLYYWVPNNLKDFGFSKKFPTSKANMFNKDGNCYKAKYSFVDNSPGIKYRPPLSNQWTTDPIRMPVVQGLYPSMAQDTLAMTPLSAIGVYLGLSSGDFEDMKCVEFFENINQASKSKNMRLFKLLLILFVLIILYVIYRK